MNGILHERITNHSDNNNNNTKTATISATKMNNSVNMSPTCRPLPTFFLEQTTFSTKKEKETPKLSEIYPPRPPIKSCPPISRLRALKNMDSDRARVISFAENSANNNNLLNSGI